jgi:abortive infection bacteriophage resistance protein
MDGKDKTYADVSKLRAWFSPARIARYESADDPSELYVWNERLSKAFLEDISHVEVLLRNFIAERLAADCKRGAGDLRWYDHPSRYNLNSAFQKSVTKAKTRLARSGSDCSYDSVIAALSFDTWRFLLVSRLEPTVWRTIRAVENGGMPNYPGTSRSDFESHVATIYELRNRCSHQEHLVLDDIGEENAYLDACADALQWVAGKIDPEAADWILANSRVEALRAVRP